MGLISKYEELCVIITISNRIIISPTDRWTILGVEQNPGYIRGVPKP